MKRLHELFMDLYSEKTGLSRTQLNKIHKKDTYMSAKEALRLNLIDEIGFDVHKWLE
jgi:ATP-dependent protease ClpP protease subunit